MTPTEFEALLTALQPFSKQGALDEELGDLTVHIDITQQAEADIRALLAHVYQHPRVLRDCSMDVQKNGGSDHLFRITTRGITLNEPAFDRLGDDTAVNGPAYESWLSAHSAHDRDDAVLDTVIELLADIAENTTYHIDFPLIVDKSEVGAVVLDHTALDGVPAADIHLHFWYDIANLRTWLADRPVTSYGDRFFPPDRLLALVYFQNSGEAIEGTEYFPVAHATADRSLTQATYRAYQDRIALTGENTTFRGGSPIITPALFAASPSLAALFRTATVYAVFAVFSDRVTQQDGAFEFYTKHGPDSLQAVVEIDDMAAALSANQRDVLRTLYHDVAEREDRETFVSFWRQSAVQQCGAITDLPTAADDIREHYRFIEAETVEGNFDDLSDAVRDTHAFMTDITSQVADTTTALSNEMQRLVFTLLGAILANLFLILRWGNIDMVIPFSLFVAGAILVFYFPLIDSRIAELAEMKAKGEGNGNLITSGSTILRLARRSWALKHIFHSPLRRAWLKSTATLIQTAG
jgi:hypothetical protein